MARYYITMSSADDTAAASAISAAGATIVKNMSFDLTYEIEATPEQLAAIADVEKSESKEVTADVQLQGTYDRSHLDMCLHPTGLGMWQPEYDGTGETVYLIDTGINASHVEFASATISNLYTNFADDPDTSDFDDESGHGTLVGSLIVGFNIGTAPGATLQNVKLFNQNTGSITVGEIVECFSAVLDHHKLNQSKTKIVCVPWTIPQNDFVDGIVSNMNKNNLVVICSAGNDGVDVNTKSPAGVQNVITVGAFNRDMEVTTFTNTPMSGAVTGFVNFGASLDIFAPGVDVTTADHANVSNYISMSGTSVAAGLAAGTATHYTQRFPDWDSNAIKENFIAEGHAAGIRYLTFDESDPNVDYSQVHKATLTSWMENRRVLADAPSGRLLNVQAGSTGTANIGINPMAEGVSVLEFAPTPPWIDANVSTSVVTVDTANIDPTLVPGVYIFAVRGVVDGVTMVEEYSVGLYNSDLAELDPDADVSSFYYDSDNSEYDEVVNYQVAPVAKN
jgi:subtilisin family serine protease